MILIFRVCTCRHGDHYQWEKVTSCIHNVFGSGGSRWVDQYGEMLITNLDRCSCKLTFVKVAFFICLCVFVWMWRVH